MGRNSDIKSRDDYVPLFNRLSNWWQSGSVEKTPKRGNKAATNKSDILVDQSKFTIDEWPELRIKVSNILWQDQRKIPSNLALDREYFQMVKLDSKSKVLDLTGGLGKSSLMIAKEKYAQVDLVEHSPALMKLEIDEFNHAGLAIFMNIIKNRLHELDLNNVKYDLIFAREILFKEKNKQQILEKCVDALSSSGHFVFSDFVLEDGASSYQIYKKWSLQEEGDVHPISERMYRKIFRNFDIKPFQMVDLSPLYIQLVNTGWKRLLEHIQNNQVDDAFVDMMMQESELWLSRVNALQSGKLKLIKFHLTW